MTENALKSETVTVPAWEGSRDAGKHFLITEWPAAKAENWALRMFIAMKGSGSEIPEAAQRMGMIGIAFAGMNAFLRADVNPDVLIPLLDELLACAKMIRDPKKPEISTQLDASPYDIMDVRTRMWLRSEVLRIHTGFSVADVLSKWMSTSKALEASSTA